MKIEFDSFEKGNGEVKEWKLSDISESTWHSTITKNSLKEYFFSTEEMQSSLGFSLFATLFGTLPLFLALFINTTSSLIWIGVYGFISVISALFSAQSILDVNVYMKLKKYFLGEQHSFESLVKLKGQFKIKTMKFIYYLVFFAFYNTLIFIPSDFKNIVLLITFVFITLIVNAGALFGMRAVHMLRNLPFLLGNIQNKLENESN